MIKVIIDIIQHLIEFVLFFINTIIGIIVWIIKQPYLVVKDFLGNLSFYETAGRTFVHGKKDNKGLLRIKIEKEIKEGENNE